MAETSIPPPPRPREYEGMDRAMGTGQLVLGLVLVVLGLVLVANPFAAVWILGVLVGVSLVFGGLAEIAAGHDGGGLTWVHWLIGLLLVVGGVAAAVWPDATVWALALVAGIVLVATGAVTLITGIAGEAEGRGTRLALGAVSLVIGLVVLAWPEATVVVLALLVGLRTILAGILCIGLGWNVRKVATP